MASEVKNLFIYALAVGNFYYFYPLFRVIYLIKDAVRPGTKSIDFIEFSIQLFAEEFFFLKKG